jgi:hypothetical protein
VSGWARARGVGGDPPSLLFAAIFRPGEPVIDAGGRRVQAHGGWILKAEGRYWWYGEDKEGPTYHNGK